MLKNISLDADASQCTLFIRLSTDGVAYAVCTPASINQPVYHEPDIDNTVSLTANLKRNFEEYSWLASPFRYVEIITIGRRFTLVPQEFFTPDMAGTYFYHNFLKNNNEIILHNVCSCQQLAVIFGMDRSAHEFLLQQHPNASFHSHACSLITYFSTRLEGNPHKQYVFLREKTIDIFAFKEQQLQAANSFQCDNDADRLYYLLYFWKTLEFEQEQDELLLCGPLEDKRQLLVKLRKFIRKVFIINYPPLEPQTQSPCE